MRPLQQHSLFLLLLLLLWTLVVLVVVPVQSCTVFLVGKDATADGSVLVSHSNDGEFITDPRLVKVPAQDHFPVSPPPRHPLNKKNNKEDTKNVLRPVYFSPEDYPRYVGTERGIPEYYPKNDNDSSLASSSFVPIGYIPQVPHTYAYIEETYGAVNEYQVGIGESTCSAIFGALPLGVPNGTALFSIDELTHVALERSQTARQAIQMMGNLAVEYGFYGAGEFEGTGESLGVIDPYEAWIFHILPDPTGSSAIWVAQRIPSNSFAVLANMFVIRQVDPNDTDNFLMSDSVHVVAQEYGWWTPSSSSNSSFNELLDFTKIYSDGEYAHKYYSGRRLWGAYHLVGQEFPSNYIDLQSDPVYPVYVEPIIFNNNNNTTKKLTEQDLFRFHRYTYQGTQYDLGAPGNLAGGPFGTPDRWKADPQNQPNSGEAQVPGNWERPIGLYRTSDTYVVKSSSLSATTTTTTTALGGVIWFGPASALGTVFTPFVTSVSEIPPSFRSGHQFVFSRKTAFWAACVTHNVANLKWSYAIQDIQQRQIELEHASSIMMEQLQQQVTSLLQSEQVHINNNVNTSNLLQQQDKTTQALDDDDVVVVTKLIDQTIWDNADKVVTSLWSLSDEILFKYASGFVNEASSDNNNNNKMSQIVGYPAWWLKAVGYTDGPPPPPTIPKCCHPPKKQRLENYHHEQQPNNNNNTSIVQSQQDESWRNNKQNKQNDFVPAVMARNHGTVLTGKAAMRAYLRSNKED